MQKLFPRMASTVVCTIPCALDTYFGAMGAYIDAMGAYTGSMGAYKERLPAISNVHRGASPRSHFS